MHSIIVRTLLICLILCALPVCGKERVEARRKGKKLFLDGKVLLEAKDGGILLLTPENELWILQPSEIEKRSRDTTPFELDDREELTRKLLAKLPEGFRVHKTAHYLICYNTTPAYAQWCGALYERLYRAFFQYWKNSGWQLREPDSPLVAFVFGNQESYAKYARAELGDATSSIIGYYNVKTNRVNMYDLTGVDQRQRNRRSTTAATINRVLSRPEAERQVATIVHEATHQLAYNSGLQVRYADNPFWVSEGIAVYFETPDLKSSKGWRNIGGVNRYNLFQFRRVLKNRPANSLASLLSADSRFRDPEQVTAAYAEAWALNYFLIRTQRKKYVAYLQHLSTQTPLGDDEPARRLKEFQQFFGTDLETLDRDFVRYIRRLR